MNNLRIDKRRMEILMPAQKNFNQRRAKQEPDLYTGDLLSVSPIADKRNSKYKTASKFTNRNKSGIKFENLKQEQYYRLNRDNKIQQNKDYADIIASKSKLSVKSSNRVNVVPSEFKNVKLLDELNETHDQINEANIQLEQITAFIQMKKQEIMKGEKNKVNSDLAVSQPKPKIMKKKSVPSNTKTTTTTTRFLKPHKPIEKIKDIDTMLNYIDQKKANNTRMEAKQMKKIDSTLQMVNTKLNKVKQKYFDADFETNRINNMINRRPKYKSVKELLKMNEIRGSTMEGSKLLQSQLEEDIINMTEAGEIVPVNNQMEVLYRNVDLIKTGSFQDNFSDDFPINPKKEEKDDHVVHLRPMEYLREGPTKYINVRTKSPPTPKKDMIMQAVNKVIEADTQTVEPKSLRNSIMKSSYLRKEFGVNEKALLDSPKSPKTPKMKHIPEVKSRKWSRDLEYLMM